MAITVPSAGDQATAAWAASVANAINDMFKGSNTSTTAKTLSSTSAFAGNASVTFTLAVETRVRIYVKAEFTPNTAGVATYEVKAGYNSGGSATIGSFNATGIAGNINYASVRTHTCDAEGMPLLAAGTYTAYASVRRVSGGDAGDQATGFQVNVIAVGFA